MNQEERLLVTDKEKVVIYTIYKKPGFKLHLARRWLILPGGEQAQDPDFLRGSPDLEKLRDLFRNNGLVQLQRSPDDDKNIIESWI